MSTINVENQSSIAFCGESIVVTVDGVKTWKQIVNDQRDFLGVTSSEIDSLNFFSGADILSPNAIAVPSKVVIASFAHEEKGNV